MDRNKQVSLQGNPLWQIGFKNLPKGPGKIYGIKSIGDDSQNAELAELVNETIVTNGLNGKILSIMGDSISTFAGWIPVADGHNLAHRARYPQANLFTDVKYCWWYKLFNDLGMSLGINDSWAGSTVMNNQDYNSGDLGPDACMASNTRITNLGSNGTPDLILVYGGTNDISRGYTVGTFDDTAMVGNIDLTSIKWDTFADAYKCMIMRMQYYYPKAKIVVMLPMQATYSSGTLNTYNDMIIKICKYFGVPVIDLRKCGINWNNKLSLLGDGIHPVAEGADLIYRYTKNQLLSFYSFDDTEHTVCSLTYNLDGVSSDKFWYKGVALNEPFTVTLTSDTLMDIDAKITMKGIDVTSEVFDQSTGIVDIPNVTGDIVITAQSEYHNWGTYAINNNLVLQDQYVFTNPDMLTTNINIASRGWAYDDTPIEEPINTLWFWTNKPITDGVVTLGIAETNSSTYIKSQSATYTKIGTEKELVKVVFPETYYLEEGQTLCLFGQTSTNFDVMYLTTGAQKPYSRVYNRVPVAYGGGTPWGMYSDSGLVLGIATGYTPVVDWYIDTNQETNKDLYTNEFNKASRGWAYDANIAGKYVNTIRFYCDEIVMNGIATIGVARVDRAQRITTQAKYTHTTTDKDQITIVFPEPIFIQTGEKIVLFGQENTNFSIMFARKDNPLAAYSRTNQSTWVAYNPSDRIELGIDVGYCADLDKTKN